MHKVNLLEVYYDVVKRCGEPIAKNVLSEIKSGESGFRQIKCEPSPEENFSRKTNKKVTLFPNLSV